MVGTTGERSHPLLDKEISYIKNWEEWKAMWESSTHAEFLLGLLHVGFGVPVNWRHEQERNERIVHYLHVADGFADPWGSLRRKEEKTFPEPQYTALGVMTAPQDFRMVLARKAFQELCENFFRNTEEHGGYAPSWALAITDPAVLEEVFWFFRLRGDSGWCPPAQVEGHYGDVARQFLLDLCKFAWECENWDRRHTYGTFSEETIEILKQARPRMLELLQGVGRLDLLLRDPLNRYGVYQDEACLQKLEELALSYKRSFPGELTYRVPMNVEEAAFVGSRAAQTLLVLRTLRAEDDRLAEVREAERKRRIAEEDLRRLQGNPSN